MAERHLLVGGVGFLGVNIASRLAGEGVEVVVLARRSSVERRRRLASVLEKLGARMVVVETLGPGDVERVEPDVIYHLAGKAGGPYRVQWEAHVGLLEREIEAAERLGSRIVYVSSIAPAVDASPLPPGSTLVEEEEHLWGAKQGFETIHAETKAEGERRLVATRLYWAILRPTLIAGRYSYHVEWRIVRLLARLGLAPNARVQAVSAGDVARIAVEAGRGGFDGRWVNIASPYTMGDYALATCKGLGRRRCARIPVEAALRLGRLAPRSSPARLAWSIARKRYIIASRLLEGFEWSLEPSLYD